jgi:hypothetical protein
VRERRDGWEEGNKKHGKKEAKNKERCFRGKVV